MPKVSFTRLLNRLRPLVWFGPMLLAAMWLLWWRLGTLTHGYALDESAARGASTSLHGIFNQPLNAPFTLLAHALLYADHHSLFAMRVTAAVFGVATLTIFYWLVRFWHGQYAALFGTLLFGFSAWFLHTARLGTPDVLLFLLLALLSCGVWFKHSGGSLPVLVGLLLASALMYVPGMVWFIGAGVIWQWRTIDRIFKKHLWMVTLGGLIVLAAMAPLGWAIYRSPDLAKTLVGLPLHGWPQPLTVLKDVAEVPVRFFIRGPESPEHWLGRLPILDVFSMGMVFLGGYVYVKRARLVRAQLLFVTLVLGTVLVGLGGSVSLSILAPFAYMLAAAGIGLMAERWFTVFPRNPIAQTVGVGLLCLVLLTSCWYGYRHYFVAWPAAPATQPVFSIQPTAASATIKK